MEFEVIFFNNLSKAIFGKNKKEFLACQPIQYALGIYPDDLFHVFDA